MEPKYTILEKIGQGAMGEVFKAEDGNLQRLVALKVLRPSLTMYDSVVRRFKREAIIASRLRHPNIVSLFALEQTAESWQIVMEYVPGISLGTLISRFGPQRPRYAIELVKQVANSLKASHAQGIIHRDIKPNNILLSNDGYVKVTDFGLAKVLHDDSDLTKVGSVLGTPRYMSPEQIRADDLTPQTDIYSLGVVLYELLSGRPVYEVSDPLVIMRKISDEPFPDVRSLRPTINPMAVKILAMMTSKGTESRYSDAGALVEDLTVFLKTGDAPLARDFDLPELSGAGLVSTISARQPQVNVTTAPAGAPRRESVLDDPQPEFCGRSGLIQEIRRRFTEKENVLSVCHGQSGEVGLGTSAVALEYARRYRKDYAHIWWIRSNNVEQTLTDYAAIGSDVGLAEVGSLRRPAETKAVKRWLTREPNWLLIFDGVRAFDQIAQLLPLGGGGHVLITSPTSSWPRVKGRVDLGRLERSESLELISKLIGRHADQSANKIATFFFDAPLGIRLGCAYINQSGISAGEYVDRLAERHSVMWADAPVTLTARHGLVSALSVTLERLEDESRPAAALVNLCANFAPDELPIDLMRLNAAKSDTPLSGLFASEETTTAALHLIHALGLFVGRPDRPKMHEVVQDIVRAFQHDDPSVETNAGRRAILQAVRGMGSRLDTEDWIGHGLRFAGDVLTGISEGKLPRARVEEILPHARALCKRADVLTRLESERATIHEMVGHRFVERDEFVRATRQFSKAIELQEQCVGKRHPVVSGLYKSLGAAYLNSGDLRRAREQYEIALGIDRVIEKGVGKARADLLRRIGHISMQLEDYISARASFEGALSVDEKLSSAPTAESGYDHALIGRALEALDLSGAALDHYARALEQYEKVYGAEHESVARAARSIGALMMKRDEPAEARIYLKRAIAASGASVDAVTAAGDQRDLGLIEASIGMPVMARGRLEKAVALFRKAYGDDHLKVATAKADLARVLASLGNGKRARELRITAYAIFARVLGPDDERSRALAKELADTAEGEAVDSKSI